MNDQDREIEKLDAAWKQIESAIGGIGETVRRLSANQGALYRYEGYKTALALISDSYLNQIHYDRKRPERLPGIGPVFNWGAPNCDLSYHMVHLEPGASYRVWGRRGNAQLVDMAQMLAWIGEDDKKMNLTTVVNQIFDEQNIIFDADGNFDFILSPHPHEGQWWKLEPDITTLMLRDLYTDYAMQNRPTVFHFDRLDDQSAAPTLPPIEEATERFTSFARGLKDMTPFFMITKVFTHGENVFQEFDFGNAGGVHDQRYFHAHFNIKPDQALVGKWKLPADFIFWNFQLYGDTYQVLNWGNRQVHLNNAMAKISADGMFYFVISHRDCGIANWLDVDGHEQGIVMARTRARGRADVSLPTLQQVPLAEVFDHLPGEVARVTASERAANLAMRRRHYQIRENC